MSNKAIQQLNVLIASENVSSSTFSLEIENSDFSSNQIVLNSMIGTLVKYDISGGIEPYLSSEYWVTADNLKWTFKLRDKLFCENGEIIDASSFKSNLVRQLKRYAKKGAVIGFEGLVGWESFLKFNDDSALKISVLPGNILEFNFDKDPENFLELLRMPYFGYWCSSLSEAPSSSGAYQIKAFDRHSVLLQVRDSWFSNTHLSPRTILFKFAPIPTGKLSSNTIVQMPYFTKAMTSKTDLLLTSSPNQYEGFILSPYKEGIFLDLRNRQIFRDRIFKVAEKYNLSNSFYLSSPVHHTPLLDTHSISTNDYSSEITFALERENYGSDELNRMNALLDEVLHPEKLKFKLVHRKEHPEDFFKKTDSNNFFDARIATVDIGENLSNSINKMMFCTTMGVSFPDPQKCMENLINSYQKNNLKVDDSYAEKFNSIILSEALIIPLKHHSKKWLVSQNIIPASMPPTPNYPRFEKILAQE